MCFCVLCVVVVSNCSSFWLLLTKNTERKKKNYFFLRRLATKKTCVFFERKIKRNALSRAFHHSLSQTQFCWQPSRPSKEKKKRAAVCPLSPSPRLSHSFMKSANRKKTKKAPFIFNSHDRNHPALPFSRPMLV